MSNAATDAFERHVAVRLQDFFDPAAPWQRSLWSPGTVVTLREILEASEAVHADVLSRPALRYLSSTAMRLVGPDPGVGPEKQKRYLQECLKSELIFEGMEYTTVRRILQDIESSYLDRWTHALRQPATCPGPERAARCIASHLLDAGLSLDLHGIGKGSPRDYNL